MTALTPVEVVESEAESSDSTTRILVSQLRWKQLVKFVATDKDFERYRHLPKTLKKAHYRDGVTEASDGATILRIQLNDETAPVGNFLIDSASQVIGGRRDRDGVVTLLEESVDYPNLTRYFDEVSATPHRVTITLDARLLKRFCETALAITSQGFFSLTMRNPATYDAGSREDVVTPILVEFEGERNDGYTTQGILNPAHTRKSNSGGERHAGCLPMLTNATNQQLQLELLRRFVHPGIGLDGAAIVADLERHPTLWDHIEIPSACLENLFTQSRPITSFTLKIAHHRLASDESMLLDLMDSWSRQLFCQLPAGPYTCVRWGSMYDD